nr:hypothetical protein [Tanacetum cinerariifolium]
MIGNVGSAENITDAEDFGPTTERDGNINLVKEVVDPNRRTDQTESQSALLLNYLKTNLTGGQDYSCNVEQRVPEMIIGMESYQGKAVQYWDHIRLLQKLRLQLCATMLNPLTIEPRVIDGYRVSRAFQSFITEVHQLKLIDWEIILRTMKDDDDEENSKGVASSNCFGYYKEEPLMKFEHEGHPQDTLTLQLIPASFRCDACNVTDEGLFHRCDSCDFWIHKTCASLAPTADIPHHRQEHPLILIYSLRVIVANFVTNTFDGMDAWLYHCVKTAYILPILYGP